MRDDINIKVGEAARIARVTVRTLHHYDAIGLLRPSYRSAGEYRLYIRQDLERLQQIRLYRELGMPLEEIRRILDDAKFDATHALRAHRQRLMSQVEGARALISTIDKMLQGASDMRAEELFDGFPSEELEREAQERWGASESWKTSKKRTAGYSKDDMLAIRAEHEGLLQEFAACMQSGAAPNSTQARELAERARLHIDRWFYPISRAAHADLAKLYVSDPRFEETYERVAPGLARFVTSTIEANAGQ